MPRIRQKPRQKWPNIRAGLSLLAMVAVGFLIAWQRDSLMVRFDALLPIRHVRVEGEFANLDPEELRKVLLPLLHRNYFRADLQAVEQAAAVLPWVAAARVARIWPDTVMVEVTEHNPVARWGSNSLISDNGVVFPADRSGDADYSGLPALQGPAGHEGEVLAMLKGLNEKFAKGRVAVVDLRLSDRLAWRAVLSDGLEVVYGNKDPLAATERMLSVLLRLAEYHPGTLKRLDFRYRSGFAVTFNPVVTAPPVERNATPKSG
jgi:cell division protein FtsQ